MKKLSLALLLLFSLTLAADHENIRLTAEAEPLLTYADCVNLLTGDFFEAEQDLLEIEPVELDLTRLYDSGHLFDGKLGFGIGLSYPIQLDYYPLQKEGCNVFIEQRYGCKIPFHAKVKRGGWIGSVKIDEEIFHEGYTNCGGRLCDTKVFYNGHFLDACPWSVHLPDGTARTYEFRRTDWTYDPEARTEIPSHVLNVLKKEVKPSGLQYFYEYEKNKLLPKRIRVCNRDGSLELARFEFRDFL